MADCCILGSRSSTTTLNKVKQVEHCYFPGTHHTYPEWNNHFTPFSWRHKIHTMPRNQQHLRNAVLFGMITGSWEPVTRIFLPHPPPKRSRQFDVSGIKGPGSLINKPYLQSSFWNRVSLRSPGWHEICHIPSSKFRSKLGFTRLYRQGLLYHSIFLNWVLNRRTKVTCFSFPNSSGHIPTKPPQHAQFFKSLLTVNVFSRQMSLPPSLMTWVWCMFERTNSQKLCPLISAHTCNTY